LIHFASLPHTLLTKDYEYCAFTMKTYRLAKMLAMAGREFTLYGPDVHDDLPGNYEVVVTEADRLRWFDSSEWDTAKVFDRWDSDDVIWLEYNTMVSKVIRKNWSPGDILGITVGMSQAQLVDLLADLAPLVVEHGIGYRGVLDYSHKVFESYAWMHYIAGVTGNEDIRYYDEVIPNCFDVSDLSFSSTPGDYLLFMGRPTPRKGLDVIREIAKRTDIPIKIAGQPGFELPGAEYVGIVSGTEKAQLLAGALAILTPTTYLEPFGGVAVEAMMSGTPVISSDYGAFTETVTNGISGYRCRTLKEFMDAIDVVRYLDRAVVRDYALGRYSLPIGATLYGEYFDKVDTLKGDGWYSL